MEIIKDVVIPFNVNDLTKIGESNSNVYLINYEKSDYKGTDFIDYLTVISLICDITNYENIDTETKFVMFNRLFRQPELVSIPCIARSLILILFKYKDIKVDDGAYSNSFFTKKEVEQYLSENKEKVEEYIKFFDSLFVFMIIFAKLAHLYGNFEIKEEFVDKQYEGITENDCSKLSPAICSVLFDSLFYDYYSKDVDTDKVEYYKQFFTKKVFLGKTIVSLLVNDSNKILLNLMELAAMNLSE